MRADAPHPGREEGRSFSTAVILHGLVHRSLMHTVAGFREQVLGPLSLLGPVDIFYHSWDVPEIHNPRAGETGETPDITGVARWLPEARGVFEPQEAFDRTVDWESLFRNNPMRSCCDGEEEARATLMNFLRALASQERAWRLFQQHKAGRYDVVVAMRADLRFLTPLDIRAFPQLHESSPAGTGDAVRPRLWAPWFHAWGGVNDRLAIGNEEAVGIWSERLSFAREWLPHSNGESSEWLLMKWLEKNRVEVGFLDLAFQRVRANGQIAGMDLDAGMLQSRNGSAGTMPPAGVPRERFLILAREAGAMAENLRSVLDPLGHVEVVVDRPVRVPCDSPHVHVPDDELAGHGGLMGRTADLPPVTSWTRALAHLSRRLDEDDRVWFVEDDVAGDAESFAALVEATRERDPDLAAWDIFSRDEDPDWYFWQSADGVFPDPRRAFQPLCRLSARLIREILGFRERHGSFIFHELLFASLAHARGMSLLDFRRDPGCLDCFSTFLFRPEITGVARGISHPVKDPSIHTAIRSIPPTGFPRLDRAAFRDGVIRPEDYLFLVRLCRKQGFTRILEFGAGDPTLAFLDAGCSVTAVERDIGRLHRAAGLFLGEEGVRLCHCPEALPPDAVPRPQLVFADGPPSGVGPELTTCGCFVLPEANARQAFLMEMEGKGMWVIRIHTRAGLAIVVDPGQRPELVTAFRNRDEAGAGWFAAEFAAWSVMFHQPWDKFKVLETGASDGTSAVLMLDELFSHPESEVHCIDLYEGEEGNRRREAMLDHSGKGRHAGRLHQYEGITREILAWMIAGEGFWESFDFIHLAGTEDAADLLADACQAWSLLKPGGTLVLDSNPRARAGIDAFLSVYGGKVAPLFLGGHVAVLKHA